MDLEDRQQALEEENSRLREELEVLQILHENTIEHGSDLENALVDQNQKLDSLQDKMKKYLSPQLYNLLLGSGDEKKMSHSRKKLTVFFSDIVEFSKITDSIESEVLSEALNMYLNSMAEIASKWGGTIDKFIGDAVMVFFGDPEFIDDKTHAINCLKMALEMKNSLKEIQKEWKKIGCPYRLQIRMGINTGYCTVGDFGSNQRMDYTIVGGQVNIAARLETSAASNSIYISRATYDLVKDEIVCEFVDDITVKGIHAPVEVYECIGIQNSPEDNYFHSERDGFILDEIRFVSKQTKEREVSRIVKSMRNALVYLEKQGFTLEKIRFISKQVEEEKKSSEVQPLKNAVEYIEHKD